ncbi:DEAD/DEAH box helicase [Bradymonas sediminis]|uniref:DEAD/DEAH box helicase n=1 Tax=Bradymonas sediminis TaxID=1548548 RepID=UPI0019550909|nr:DEAD/DEAH box helicase [Bradymonas sediminis]
MTALRAVLGEVAECVGTDECVAGDLTLLLPSSKHGPQGSPRLVRDEEPDPTFDRLAPWTVPTLALKPGEAPSLLGALPEEFDAALLGDSLRYWRVAARLAEEFVRAGRVLPGVKLGDDGARAVWRALPATAEDFARLQAMRDAMPPMARAGVNEAIARSAKDDGWESVDMPSARRVLVAHLNELVDALVREKLLAGGAQTGSHQSHTVHQQWLHALASTDGALNAAARDLASLGEDLHTWTQPLRATEERGMRLCFRLAPPEPDVEDAPDFDDGVVSLPPDPWRVDFLLQATDDPSLLIEAAVVWQSSGRTLKVLERNLEHPQEALLEELGRALRLFPALEGALHTAKPTHVDLSAGEAYAFLNTSAPVLEQSGFGIIVPAWWGQPERRLGAKLKVRSKSSSDPRSSTHGLGVSQLCEFHWEVALGNQELSREELERLAELKMPLVRMRGQWVSLRPEDIARALRLFDAGEGGQMTAGEAIRTGLGLEGGAGALPVIAHEFEGWLGEFLERDFDAQLADATTPDGFNGVLRPYQERGVAWLGYLEQLGFGACLADDMGLGKTIQVLAKMVEERGERASAGTNTIGTTMVVCPLSVVGNWRREAHKFAPMLQVYVHHGPERLRDDKLLEAIAQADLIITTYGVVRSDVEELSGIAWHRVVLDEAQKIKNSSAGRTQAVRALSARRRLALTGTPVENRLLELWSIMQFLNPGLLGSAQAFDKKIAKPIESQGDAHKAELLRRLTGPFILRRLKTDKSIISDLPEKIEIKEYCNLTREQATLYRAVVEEMLARIERADKVERQGLILVLMTQLKQVCNHPAQFLQDSSAIDARSGKLERLERLAEEILDAGDKALIFTQYTEMGGLIRRQLQQKLGRRVLYLHGATPQRQRDAMVEQFQSPEGPPFFLLSLHAGGTGLTLTAANHVIHYDRWWNPAVENQATDRAFRIGQTANVQVRKFICAGTIEERIDGIIERKKHLADQVLTSGEGWLMKLSTDELRELVELSEETLI